jgi:hypothetical protein
MVVFLFVGSRECSEERRIIGLGWRERLDFAVFL